MDEILDRLLAGAERNFGPVRAREMKPLLDQVALDLQELSSYPLEPVTEYPLDSSADHSLTPLEYE